MKSFLVKRALAAFCLAFASFGQADGLIVIHNPPASTPGHFSFAPLEVSRHDVDVKIDGLIATTSVDQEFFNPNSSRLEGTYVFPLPEGAHIDKFSMDIDGRMVEAELLSAEKARSLYEDIVRKMRDPALLEYAGRGAFKARIFPIEPRASKRVKISYTQLLKNDFGSTEYAYPLNTEKFSSAPLKELSVKVFIDGKTPLKSVYCPSHKVEIARDGACRATALYSARDLRPDSDFKLVFSRSAEEVGVSLLFSRKPGEDGYFMLLASPGKRAESEATPKEVCLVLDSSGSMAGPKLAQAKKALLFCLANLNKEDRFEIVRFSTEAESVFKGLAPASKENLSKAESFIEGIKPIGGTAISEALSQALSLSRDDARRRPYSIVFLTDGLPTIGESSEDRLATQVEKTAKGARIFAFGLGSDVNTHLLDRMATATRGSSQYVLPSEDIEIKVSELFSKIKDPVLCELSLSLGASQISISQTHPRPLPDLFNGEMLAVFGRYSGSGKAELKISGTANGTKREFGGRAEFPERAEGNSFVAQLWAERRIGWLLDEIRLHGESAELRDETARLAREFGVVTPYTAWLIIEDEKRREVPFAFRNFQELERDARVNAQLKFRMSSVKKEAAAESARSGADAFDNAIALQELKQGSVYASRGAGRVQGDLDKSSAAPLAPGSSLGYRAEQSRNYAQQARVVNGRAFYQNGKVWTDSNAQAKPNAKLQQLAFNSKEYFELLRAHPEIAPWLSLGAEMDLLIGETLYQIREDSRTI